MNKQMQKNGFKSNILRSGFYFSLLAMVLFGQVANASTRFYDYGVTGVNYSSSGITYTQAVNFCTGTGLRLPTSAEIVADYNGDNNLNDYNYWSSTTGTNGHIVVNHNVGSTIDVFDTDTTHPLNFQPLYAVCIYDTDLLSAPAVASFFSNTNAFDNLSTVTTGMVDSVLPWLYLILGVVIAFFIIEKIIAIIPNKDIESDRKTEQMIARGTAMKEKIDKLPE